MNEKKLTVISAILQYCIGTGDGLSIMVFFGKFRPPKSHHADKAPIKMTVILVILIIT